MTSLMIIFFPLFVLGSVRLHGSGLEQLQQIKAENKKLAEEKEAEINARFDKAQKEKEARKVFEQVKAEWFELRENTQDSDRRQSLDDMVSKVTDAQKGVIEAHKIMLDKSKQTVERRKSIAGLPSGEGETQQSIWTRRNSCP